MHKYTSIPYLLHMYRIVRTDRIGQYRPCVKLGALAVMTSWHHKRRTGWAPAAPEPSWCGVPVYWQKGGNKHNSNDAGEWTRNKTNNVELYYINRICLRQGSAPGPIGKVGWNGKRCNGQGAWYIFKVLFRKVFATEMLLIHVAKL